MANYDEEGNVVISPLVKAPRKPKADKPAKKGGGKLPPPIRILGAPVAKETISEVLAEVESIIKSDAPDEAKAEATRRSKRNRGFGKAVENAVATMYNGDVVPASGAIKTSVWNLLGDVQIRADKALDNQPFVVVECKGTSGITPAGDKTFTMKRSVVDQMVREAKSMKAPGGGRVIGALYVHWKNANYQTDDYVLLSSDDFGYLLDLAKTGHKASR